jgi:hypothetical protein
MKIRVSLPVVALSLASVLSGCGGGGGGGDSGTGSSLVAFGGADFAAVAGTAVNLADDASAQKAAATAAQQAMNSGAGSVDPSLLTGAQASSSQQPLGIHDVLLQLPQWLASSDPGVLTAATTRTCAKGGSLTVSSNRASRVSLSTGATVTLSADRCVQTEGNATIAINGSLVATVLSGSFGANGPSSPGTRLNFEFTQFQMGLTEGTDSTAIGMDGGLSVAYQWPTGGFTSKPLTTRPAFTTVIRHNGRQLRHTISDFELTYLDRGFITEVGGFATVNSSTPGLGLPSRYRWTTTSGPLVETGSVITSGALLLTGQSNDPSVTVRFGQPCLPNGGNQCVTVQRTVNGVPQPTQTLTWAQFEALSNS